MGFSRQLEDLERYLEKMEAYLTERAQESQGQEQADMESAFPNLLRASVFVTIYSTVEAEITRICKEQQNTRKIKLSMDELRGNGIIRAHNYLSRVCEIKVPKGEPWKDLLSFNTLRNVIVHRDGEENHRNLAGFIQEHPHLEKEGLNIYMSAPFCQEVIATARMFFNQLSETLAKK